MKTLSMILLFTLLSSLVQGAQEVKSVNNPNLKISFVDIGQGDAEVIRDLETQKVIVVDTGVKNSGIVEYLKSEGIKTVNLLILTHPHSDHIGAGVQIIENFTVKRVMDPGFKHSSRTYLKLLQKIKEKNIPYVKAVIGQNIKFGKSQIKVLAPPREFIKGTRSDTNSNSVVFMLQNKNFKVYFAADSEHETEEFVLKNNSNLQADILKVAHHGSRYATSNEFLDIVKPKVAIISAGLNNSYHHPHKVTIDKLNERKIKTYITFKVGTIEVLTNGEKYSIKTVKKGNSNAHNSIEYIQEEDPDNYQEIIENNREYKNKKQFAQIGSNGKAILKKGYFYSSKNSKTFYAWNCKGIRRVKPSNLLEFSSYDEAVNSGRHISSRCKYKPSPKNDKSSKSTLEKQTAPKSPNSDNSGKININTASKSQLRSIKGIGEKTAQKIIEYRKKNKFKKISDIMKIKGIGKGKFRKIKDYITVD